MRQIRKTVNQMIKRSNVDRRGEQDRRQLYDIAIIDKFGFDRRKPGKERRKTPELRTGWIRVSKWSSVCVAYLSA